MGNDGLNCRVGGVLIAVGKTIIVGVIKVRQVILIDVATVVERGSSVVVDCLKVTLVG